MLLHPTSIRIGLGLVTFLGVLFAPWWVPLIGAVLLSMRYRAWEVIVIGIFMDLLWLPESVNFSLTGVPIATLVATGLVFGFEPLRRLLLTGPSSF